MAPELENPTDRTPEAILSQEGSDPQRRCIRMEKNENSHASGTAPCKITYVQLTNVP
jgi:hypothetical protein